MTTIDSQNVVINRSDREVFNFLSNFNNFRHLMPDQVVNWQSTDETCAFTIQGMADLGMKIAQKEPHSKLVMASEGKNPFPFTLLCHLESLAENQTQVHLVFDADMNPMLAMMAKRPLQNFVNMLSDKLKEVAENGGF